MGVLQIIIIGLDGIIKIISESKMAKTDISRANYMQ